MEEFWHVLPWPNLIYWHHSLDTFPQFFLWWVKVLHASEAWHKITKLKIRFFCLFFGGNMILFVNLWDYVWIIRKIVLLLPLIFFSPKLMCFSNYWTRIEIFLNVKQNCLTSLGDLLIILMKKLKMFNQF